MSGRCLAGIESNLIPMSRTRMFIYNQPALQCRLAASSSLINRNRLNNPPTDRKPPEKHTAKQLCQSLSGIIQARISDFAGNVAIVV